MKKALFTISTIALLAVGVTPAAASTIKLKVVYGWAAKSGKSALTVKPYRARLSEVGESGLLAWDLYKRNGSPIKIAYTRHLDFHQVNKTCGKRAAGYPYDTSSKRSYGTKACASRHLTKLLTSGRIPVRLVYDTTSSKAVKVTELVIP